MLLPQTYCYPHVVHPTKRPVRLQEVNRSEPGFPGPTSCLRALCSRARAAGIWLLQLQLGTPSPPRVPSTRACAVAALCALLFALCLNCRRALKILYPPRQCRAGRSARRPGAGRRMTSRGLWPLSRKFGNGKREAVI